MSCHSQRFKFRAKRNSSRHGLHCIYRPYKHIILQQSVLSHLQSASRTKHLPVGMKKLSEGVKTCEGALSATLLCRYNSELSIAKQATSE
jgi:hypothetical protein